MKYKKSMDRGLVGDIMIPAYDGGTLCYGSDCIQQSINLCVLLQ